METVMGPELDDDDDTLDLTQDDELKPGPDDDGDDDDDGSDDDSDSDEEDEGEGPGTVTFGDEDPDDGPADNSTIRRMRQELRETKRKLAEAERVKTPPPIEIGDKPTLETCGYDEDTFETELDKWKDRKHAADQQAAKQNEDNRKINEAWQQDLARFEQNKGKLEFEDRDDAIETVTTTFDMVQQAVIVKAAGDPALFLYALSKSEAKRDELAKIHDPIKMAAAVARMEGAVKVTKGRKAPEPDRPARGSSAMPGGTDKQLEKLEKEADRTGNRTKLIAYQTQLEKRAKAKSGA